MKYVFDSLYTIIPDNKKYIVYCGNLRKAIKLSYTKMYLYKTIVENQYLMSTEKMLSEYGISKKDYESFINQMVERKIIFTSKKDFDKEDFGHRYKKLVDKNKLMRVYLHVTQKCNLKCYYCYNKRNLNSDRRELSADEWKKVIFDLYSGGVREFVITGGEPTIRNDLEEILSSIPNDCNVSVLTNGTLLKGSKLKILQYASEVIVSLDSLEKKNNDSNRKNSSNYNVISNIENISDNQKKKIVVRSVITKNNVKDVVELRNYVKNKLNIKYITTGYLPNSKMEYDEFIPIKNEVNYNLKMNNLISCGACLAEIAVDCNGDIYPCQSMVKPEFCLGNILEKNWRNKIKEKKEKIFPNANINEIEKCKECVYKYFCGNGCKAITYNIYHNINCCNYFFCEFYKENARNDIKKLFNNNKIDEKT